MKQHSKLDVEILKSFIAHIETIVLRDLDKCKTGSGTISVVKVKGVFNNAKIEIMNEYKEGKIV